MAHVVDTPADGLRTQLAEYRPRIQRHLFAMVHDAIAAEDLTQETYGRALTRLDSLRDRQAALAWLYRIATNTALDRLRQKQPSVVPLDDVTTGEAEAVSVRDRSARSLIEEALEHSEMSACIQRYLETLPDDQRVAILLHDVHGLTNPEVAAAVGCSLPTAKIRVHRAHKRLRDTLEGVCSFEFDDRGCSSAASSRPRPEHRPFDRGAS